MGVQPYTGVDVTIKAFYEREPVTKEEREMLLYMTAYTRNAIIGTNINHSLEKLYDILEEAYAAHKGGARNG